MNCIFFGSTQDSRIVLTTLHAFLQKNGHTLTAIITQPPKPVGRKQEILPTPVETYGKEHTIPVLSFPADAGKPWLYQNEKPVTETLVALHPDIVISASFGQKIPQKVITAAKYGGLNIHPSMLPRWRGADPVPWAILAGDSQIGVSVVILGGDFDDGRIIAQEVLPLPPTALPDSVRSELFTIGSNLLTHILPDYFSGKVNGIKQENHMYTYARRLSRQDGYVPWEIIDKAMKGLQSRECKSLPDLPVVQTLNKFSVNISPSESLAIIIDRLIRALTPWPGTWSLLSEFRNQNVQIREEVKTGPKRVKILQAHIMKESLVIDRVQVEGKKPVQFPQFADAYL